jgi:unsaturated chondroitin disaccharide hydrolase
VILFKCDSASIFLVIIEDYVPPLKKIFLKQILIVMMFKPMLLSLLSILLMCSSCFTESRNIAQANLSFAEKRLKNAVEECSDPIQHPRSVNQDGSVEIVNPGDWTSGFFPGILWYLYEYFEDPTWLKAAQDFTMNLKSQKFNTSTHDLGFILYCSFGNGYRLTKDSLYREILLQGAKSLSSRYNPNIGCTRSWDHHDHIWDFPVIIDNMMNLELLFFATRETGDSTYYNIAVNHANKTLQHHFRDDYSSYHVVDYDSLTGEVIKKNTHQGYADNSSWSRGQAWGLYGYTMAYRETGIKEYLTQAIHIANFILKNETLPEDKIPWWDFDDPKIPNTYRDASAAAIISSALFELSAYTEEYAFNYYNTAEKILASLSDEKYRFGLNDPGIFLLKHGVGNIPAGTEIDVPLIYGDYYFIEANLRKHSMTTPGYAN